jgi:ABC-type branched-subunit amino acid transport system ATPase component
MPRDNSEESLLLRASGISKKFGGQTVLDNVDVELGCGEIVLLKGDNGSGKTTLLNILTANIEPDAGRLEFLMNGNEKVFEFPRLWTHNLNLFDRFTPERVAQLGVGRTWQDVRLSLTQSLRDNIAVATPHQLGENPLRAILQPLKVIKQERRNLNYADAMLSELDLAGRELSSADKISLGQSKRVAIARAIRAGAKVLFLDEPLAGLDAVGVDKVTKLLQTLARERGVTLVIIEHVYNIPKIMELATAVWTLDRGKLTIETCDRILAEKQISGGSIQDWLTELAGTQGKIVNHHLLGGAILSTVIPVGRERGEPILEVEDLVVYRGKRLVIGQQAEDGSISGLSFSLYKGQLSILQAPNGWGKTTLLDAIAGLSPIARGQIRLNGQPIKSLPIWERARKGLAYLRSREQVFLSVTVREMLRLSGVDNISDRVQSLLDKKVSELSGGERQRVTIVCIQRVAVNVYLLDEPFGALDLAGMKVVQRMLETLIDECNCLVALPANMMEGQV